MALHNYHIPGGILQFNVVLFEYVQSCIKTMQSVGRHLVNVYGSTRPLKWYTRPPYENSRPLLGFSWNIYKFNIRSSFNKVSHLLGLPGVCTVGVDF